VVSQRHAAVHHNYRSPQTKMLCPIFLVATVSLHLTLPNTVVLPIADGVLSRAAVLMTEPAAPPVTPPAAFDVKLTRSKSTKGVLNLVEKNTHALNAANCATALHQLAVINKHQRAGRDALLRDARFEQLLRSMIDRSSELTARSVSDVLWSLATLQHWPSWMLVPVLTVLNSELDKGAFEARHMATATWALGKLETKPVRLLEKIETQVKPQLGALDNTKIAQLMWGFAALKYRPPTLLPELATVVTDEMIRGALPVEISSLAFAVGEFAQPHENDDLLLTLARGASPDAALPRFSSRQLVTMLDVYAKLDAASQLPSGLLDAWVLAVRTAHEARPLMAQDARTLEAALASLEIDASWVKRSEMLNLWIESVDGTSGGRRKFRSYTDEELKAAFDAIDSDKSGDIGLDELRTAIRAIKTSTDDEAVAQMLKIADADGSGSIDFEEFKELMRLRRRGSV